MTFKPPKNVHVYLSLKNMCHEFKFAFFFTISAKDWNMYVFNFVAV